MTPADFKLLRSNNADKLEEAVNAALKEGYQLHGSPLVVSNETKIFFYQAVYKPARA